MGRYISSSYYRAVLELPSLDGLHNSPMVHARNLLQASFLHVTGSLHSNIADWIYLVERTSPSLNNVVVVRGDDVSVYHILPQASLYTTGSPSMIEANATRM